MKMTRQIQSAAITADNRAVVLHADLFQVAKTKDQLVFESPPVCFYFFLDICFGQTGANNPN